MSKWICLIGNSLNSASAIRRLGFECNAVLDIRKNVPKEFYGVVTLMTSANLQNDKQTDNAVELLIKQFGTPSAFISHTEHGYRHVVRLSQRYGLAANSAESLVRTRQKPAMREVLNQDAEHYVEYFSGDADSLYRQLIERPSLDYIIKPADGWGSRLVNHIRDHAALETWRELNGEKWPVWIAEEYLEGPEYSVEIVRTPSHSLLLGVTEKVTSGAPHYYETGHIFPAPSVNTALGALILKRVSQALELLNIQLGATHTEVRIHPRRGPLLIETHIRPGGDYISELIKYSTGYDVAELSIASVLNVPIPENITAFKGAAVYFFTQGAGYAQSVTVDYPVVDDDVKKWEIDIVPGTATRGTTDSTNRAGCVLCVAETAVEAWKKTLMWANRCHLNFVAQ